MKTTLEIDQETADKAIAAIEYNATRLFGVMKANKNVRVSYSTSIYLRHLFDAIAPDLSLRVNQQIEPQPTPGAFDQ